VTGRQHVYQSPLAPGDHKEESGMVHGGDTHRETESQGGGSWEALSPGLVWNADELLKCCLSSQCVRL
jgi:hypothetical protein